MVGQDFQASGLLQLRSHQLMMSLQALLFLGGPVKVCTCQDNEASGYTEKAQLKTQTLYIPVHSDTSMEIFSTATVREVMVELIFEWNTPAAPAPDKYS